MYVEKVSIIIPVYNTAPYLKGCLDSVLVALKNIPESISAEIICINDGSTDKSLTVLQQYAAQDTRIQLIDQDNKGVSAARNAGLDVASGEAIAFIDSDDRIHPRYFDILLRIMNKTNADAVACEYIRIPEESFLDGWRPTTISKKRQVKKITHRGVLNTDHLNRYIWGRLYKRDLIGENRFDITLTLGEDTAFTLQILCKKEDMDFWYVKEALYYYCQRDNSAVKELDHSLVVNCIKNVYLPYYEEFGSCKAIILEQAVRSLLLERYVDTVKSQGTMLKEYDDLLKTCQNLFSDFRILKRLFYRLLIKVPALYRTCRIINDPSLLSWERQQKADINKEIR